jgi:hypothetical protein
MRFLLRLHRDDSAQISFLAVAGCLCFVALLSMVINTNEIVSDRVHMQDVADVTALSAASWTARGLNTISFVNVMNTKLISTAILLNALKDAIPVINSVGEVQQAIFNACSGVPFVGPFCAAAAVVVRVQLTALSALKSLVNPLAQSLSKCPNGTLWTIMEALAATATGVQKSFGAIGIAESVSIARANGADFGLVVNGALQDGNAQDALFLPVVQKGFDEHCDFLQKGGRGYEMQGYSENTGPLKVGKDRINANLMLPWITMFSRPIFSGMVVSHTLQVGCTPDPSDQNQKIKVLLKDLNECRQYGARAMWSHIFSTTRTVLASDPEYGNLTLRDFVPWRPKRSHAGSRSADDANADEILGQIGDLNLPTGGGDVPSEAQQPLGKGNDLITEASERQRGRQEIRCSGGSGSYPFYSGSNNEVPGFLFCLGTLDCRRITERSEFTWFNSQHREVRTEEVGGYFIRVYKRTIEEDEQPTRVQYSVEVVVLASAGETEMDQQQFVEYMAKNREQYGMDEVDTSASQDSSGCTRKPDPWVLNKGTSQQERMAFDNKLRFIGVVYRDIDATNSPYFWSRFFRESPPRLIAYGQAQVYNRLQEDTFTQDWRVRLERASLLEDLLKSGKLSSVGGRLSGRLVEAVNNH